VLPLVVPFLTGQEGLNQGDRARRTFTAVKSAQYESQAETAQQRDQAARAVADVPLPPDPAIRQQQTDRADKLFDQVRFLRQRADLSSQQKLTELNSNPAAKDLSTAGKTALLALDAAALDGIQQRVDRALGDILSRAIQKDDIDARITDYLAQSGNAPTVQAELTALREMLRAFVVPTFQVDTAATQKLRDEARANVQPVFVTWTAGQVIVSEGQELTAADIEALRATGVLNDGFDYAAGAAGLVVAMGFGGLLAAYAYQFQPFNSAPGRRMALIGFSTVATLIAVRVTLPLVTPDRDQQFIALALPVAAAAMVAASFADLPFAAILALCCAFLATYIGATSSELVGSSFVSTTEALEMAMAYAASGLAGAVVVHRAERVSRYAVSAIVVAAATFAVLVTFWLIDEPRTNAALGWISLVSAMNGLGSAMVTIGVFVVFSMAFGVTTRLQLMELAHSGHPLLRRLQDEAPGTYHHSMMVGALAERAADQVGADALIARVGAYYHDIGKLQQPNFYIENLIDGSPSPHDSLEPEESAARIREHVTKGWEVARQHRLPAVVRDFIPQHHGTRLVSFFYRQAVQAGRSVDPSAYRYPGPRPQTKEAAIVMLADSCEAVVRARQDRSGPDIEDLVDGVFAERLAEGQFDECDITMRELQQIATSFKTTLRAVYHPRIEYPSPGPEELAQMARG
jgi:putative nucleotidyltransferase with HDIG domain